jgi:hypothetical protein
VILFFVLDVVENVLGNFLDRLHKFWLTGIASPYTLDELCEIYVV